MATATAIDHVAIVKKFVEAKIEEGNRWLCIFKNRSGQCSFTIYDPANGNPTNTDAMYLVSDPDGGGAILPRHLTVRPLFLSKIVGIEITSRTEESQLLEYLEQGFQMLKDARKIPQ